MIYTSHKIQIFSIGLNGIYLRSSSHILQHIIINDLGFDVLKLSKNIFKIWEQLIYENISEERGAEARGLG